jgi:hypothetical protein
LGELILRSCLAGGLGQCMRLSQHAYAEQQHEPAQLRHGSLSLAFGDRVLF